MISSVYIEYKFYKVALQFNYVGVRPKPKRATISTYIEMTFRTSVGTMYTY